MILTGKTKDQVSVESLATLKVDLCAKIEGLKDTIMRAGFEYQGSLMQGDAEAQANLMGWVLLNAQGVLTFPRAWRRSDNTFLSIETPADLLTFAGAMANFKDRVYSGIFTAKDTIRTATDGATAQGIFDAWLAETGTTN